MTRRHSIWALMLLAFFAVSTLHLADAEARRKKRKKRRRAKVTKKANVKALRELMGPFKFGMSEKQVIKVVKNQIKERYAEQIAQSNDVYEQDRLRTLQRQEVNRLKKSKVKFEGRKTGWDVSLIDDQFTHGTNESMMVHWETHQGKNQRRFFFFYDGELYKMFVQLDTAKLGDEQKSFKFFRALMEKRFGKGRVHATGLSWKLRDIHVDAIDKLKFYNSFCLIMTEPRRAREVAELRAERQKKGSKYNPVIRSVIEDVDDGGPDIDEGAGNIDRLLDKL